MIIIKCNSPIGTGSVLINPASVSSVHLSSTPVLLTMDNGDEYELAEPAQSLLDKLAEHVEKQ